MSLRGGGGDGPEHGGAWIDDNASIVAGEDWHGPHQGGVAHIHPGTSLTARNVCRLLCASRFVSQVSS